ncbi:hypothetical protein Tco_0348107 [Tanacetum coccineum]
MLLSPIHSKIQVDFRLYQWHPNKAAICSVVDCLRIYLSRSNWIAGLDGEGGSTLIGAGVIEPTWINKRSHEHIVKVLQMSLEEFKQERACEKDLLEIDNVDNRM